MEQPARRPYVTCLIALIISAAFGLQMLHTEITDEYALVGSLAAQEPVRILTGAFLHADVMHFITNTVTLLYLGSVIEAAMGHVSMFLIYAASLVGGQAAVLLWTDPAVTTVGASGAIYGLFGAAIIVNLVTRSWNALFLSLGVVAGNVVMSYTMTGISWQAHLGGLVTGTVVAIPCAIVIMSWARRRARKEEEIARRVGYYPQQY